jgi:hypothetical protein
LEPPDRRTAKLGNLPLSRHSRISTPIQASKLALLVQYQATCCRFWRSLLRHSGKTPLLVRDASTWGSLALLGWPVGHGHPRTMAPGAGEKRAEKSYLSSAVDSINPWSSSRSSTPTPKDPQPAPAPVNPGDHSINSFYGHSFKKYPYDCPPLAVQWFHATDVSCSWHLHPLLHNGLPVVT